MRIALIAAVARDGGIGRDGDLLWRERADQTHFRDVTMGHPVVMGRRTWESIPPKFRPLPGRRNLVVTRNSGFEAPGAEVVPSLDAALDILREAPLVFVIGGGELYAQALPRAGRLELTEIDAVFDADAHFPAWDREQFDEVARRPGIGTDGTRYAFVTYERRSRAGS